MAAALLAEGRGWEGSTQNPNATGEKSEGCAPGFFCNAIQRVWIQISERTHVRLHAAPSLPGGVGKDPAVLRFNELLLDEVLLV